MQQKQNNTKHNPTFRIRKMTSRENNSGYDINDDAEKDGRQLHWQTKHNPNSKTKYVQQEKPRPCLFDTQNDETPFVSLFDQ